MNISVQLFRTKHLPLRLISLSAMVALSTCGTPLKEEVSSKLADGRVPGTKRLGTLGGGWDVNKEEWRGDCAEGLQGYEGAQEASVKFDRSMSEKETSSSLGFSLDARARYGVYEGDLAAEFARDSSSNSYSESATYSAVYKFKNLKLKSGHLSAIGKAAWERGGEDFVKTCGHEYVDQLQLGARFLVNIKMEFSSKAEKQNFSANIGLRGPAFSVRAKLEEASKSLSRSASVSIRLYQQGGNISRITSALSGLNVPITLGDESQTASAVVVCSIDRLDACLKVIDGAVKYATDTNIPDSFPNQINFNTLDLSSPYGPAILGYVTAPWTDLAVYPPDPFTQAEVKDARKVLFDAFEKQLAYRNRVDAVLAGAIRLSPSQNLDFDEKKKAIYANVEKIVDAGKTCYVNISNCSSAKNAVMAKNNPNYIDEEFDILPQTFAQWCDISKLPVHRLSLKKTVDQMLNFAKLDLNSLGTDPCGTANRVLSESESLDLSNSGINSLAPVASLTKLKHLNVRKNELKSLSEISGLKSLLTVNAAYNQIREVAPLKSLVNLEQVSLQGNKVSDAESLKVLPKLQIRYLTESDVCERARLHVLEKKAFSVADVDSYRAIDFAPEFKTAFDWESGVIGWSSCAAIAQLLN